MENEVPPHFIACSTGAFCFHEGEEEGKNTTTANKLC